MTLKQKINSFVNFGSFMLEVLENKKFINPKLTDYSDKLKNLILTEHYHNQWFTPDSVKYALTEWGNNLTQIFFDIWLSKYNFEEEQLKRVAVIMAGNLPMVGFHDFLCVLITGNIFIGKLSQKDNNIIKLLADILIYIEPQFENRIFWHEYKITDFELVIATGSNNSSRYFDFYFAKYPNIIRKNRNSIAILDQTETTNEMQLLAHDIFTFFGLGCRNVSKLLVPNNFDVSFFFENMNEYKEIIFHNKYANNYIYNRAVYLMNRIQFFENNFVILKEDTNISSPVSVVYFEKYDNLEKLDNYILENAHKLQCVVTKLQLANIKTTYFGETQKPKLWEYADNIDTIEFLLNNI